MKAERRVSGANKRVGLRGGPGGAGRRAESYPEISGGLTAKDFTKEREICAALFGERVLQHALMNVCDRSFERGEWNEKEYQNRLTALTAFTENADARSWRRGILADCEERRARTVCCAAAAGTTMRRTAAPRTGTGTTRATATTLSASASVAPQHRRINRAVPAVGLFALCCATNDKLQIDSSSVVETINLPLAILHSTFSVFHLPLYMVMTDAQMAEAVKDGEPTLEALRRIDGFGEARMSKYGERLLKED